MDFNNIFQSNKFGDPTVYSQLATQYLLPSICVMFPVSVGNSYCIIIATHPLYKMSAI